MRSLTLLCLTASVTTAAVGQQPARARCRDCPPGAESRAVTEANLAQIRDSLRARAGGGLEGDIERIAVQLLMQTQLQNQARQGLSALQSGRVADEDRAQAELALQRFRQQFEQASRKTQSLRSQLAALCDRNAKPQGYMGITFSATMSADAAASGDEIFRFAENPTVETVEPGSPAERAGVEKGDEIIRIGGDSVVGRDIVFTRLLRPGNRLPLRVRRDGNTRDVLLVISRRPPSLDSGCPFLDARIMAAFGDPVMVSQLPLSGAIVRTGPVPTPSGSATAGTRVRVLRPGEAPPPPTAAGGYSGAVVPTPAPMMPSVPLPAPAIAEPRGERNVFIFSGGSTAPMVIAGATIVRTNADLRETFGVKSGVLVLDVARGSPAYASGLKGGDIIVSVGRGAVTSPLSVQRAIESASAQELTLRIIRKKKQQSLVLRW
jgi:membrane-associated protease RseP (regulator of RpoE activity)